MAIQTSDATPTRSYGLYAAHDASHYMTKTPSSIEVDKWNAAINRVDGFWDLFDDWDGDNAVAPSGPVTEWAKYFMKGLRSAGVSAPDRVMPSLDGHIVAEWQLNGDFAELDFPLANQAEFIYVRSGSLPIFYDLSNYFAPDSPAVLSKILIMGRYA